MSMRAVANNERATPRAVRAEDAPALLALITPHVEEGHRLPRRLRELSVRAPRFVVVERACRLVGCAELAPLSTAVGEVGSLVVASPACALFQACGRQAPVRSLHGSRRGALPRAPMIAGAKPHAY